MAFNHEKLKIYERTLRFNAKVSKWTSHWDSKHAVCGRSFRMFCGCWWAYGDLGRMR